MKKNILISAFTHRIIVATVIFLCATYYFVDVQALKNAQDRLLINPVYWIMVALYPVILWQEWKERAKTNETLVEENEDDESKVTLTKKLFLYMVFIVIYLVGLNYTGFIMTSLLIMPILMIISGAKSKSKIIIVPIVTVFILYMIFGYLLEVPLPQGLFIEEVFE